MSHPILTKAAVFLDTVFANLPSELQHDELPSIDHLCYRVTSTERYSQLKHELAKTEILEDESEVNGRPICIFRLREPIVYRQYVIDALELPAPSTKPYAEGFEHLEFVISDIEAFLVTHPTLAFDTKGLSRKTNRDLSLKLTSTTSVKFHENHIFDVLVHQRNLGETTAA